jgi:ribosomal protein S18 acetylase RimI-like enzyme
MTSTHLSDLQAARPNDPLLMWRVDPAAITDLLVDGDHVAWIEPGLSGPEAWGVVLGQDPARVVSLLRVLDHGDRLAGVTLLEGVRSFLPDEYASHDAGGWSLWVLGEAGVQVEPGDAVVISWGDPRIDEVLEHSTSSYLGSASPRVAMWSGIERDGRLVAVAGVTREPSGAVQLVSVCAVPEVRGQGLAGQVCAHLIQRVGPVPAVVLEMYTANASAASLYRRLGFHEAQRHSSGLIDSRRAPTPAP